MPACCGQAMPSSVRSACSSAAQLLVPGARAADIEPKPWHPDTSTIEPAVRALAENAAVRCGLRLPDEIMEELVAVAPWALAMARRLNRDHSRDMETASIFDPGRDIE